MAALKLFFPASSGLYYPELIVQVSNVIWYKKNNVGR